MKLTGVNHLWKYLYALLTVSLVGAVAVLIIFPTAFGFLKKNERQLSIPGILKTVPENYFGMHFHYLARDTVWPEIGVGSWRLWNSYTDWVSLQRSYNNWDFGTLDRSIAIAEEQRVEPMIVLGMTPSWASARPEELSPYGKGAAAEPVDLDFWRAYVRKVVNRYKGRVPYYEIWNEPDLKITYTGTPEKMAELTKVACQEIKRIDPAAKVVAPALTSGDHAFRWYEKFLTAIGPDNCFDVIGWHFYTAENAPEQLFDIVAKMRAMQKKYSIEDKPVWNTESGYYLENDDGPRVAGTIGDPDKLILNSELATAYLMRSYILGYALGIERFYWYAWDDEELGLREPKSKRVKRAGVAYGTLQRWLVGSELSDCKNSIERLPKIWRCSVKKSGRLAHIVWSTMGYQKVAIPPDWSIKYFESDAGDSVPVGGAELAVGEVPMLLKSESGKW